VYVDDHLCGVLTFVGGVSQYEVDCNGAVGKTIEITQNNQIVSLCEVEVFKAERVQLQLTDATQSSDESNGVASRAIDGNTDGYWSGNSCSHTLMEENAWWEAKISQKRSAVGKILISNRVDCCSDRLTGAKVYVDDHLCGVLTYVGGVSQYEVDCNGAVGNTIGITQNNQIVSLCEVEVFAPQPIDGGLSKFSDWSECSVACGGGSQSRSRSCTNPSPAFGGAGCDGDDSESRDCNASPCPVDGGWSDFSDWSECSVTCGGGSQSRSKSCSNPAPAFGGAGCDGDDSESRDCNVGPCPWRSQDKRCGPDFPLADGSPGQCNPDHPDGAVCCSKWGWCNSKPKSCTCRTCVNYGRK